MSNQRKHLPSFLVAISLLLLLSFLLFWNIDRFNSEKEELVEKLETQMSLACSEYRDSVVQHVFKLMKVKNGKIGHQSPNVVDNLPFIKPSIETILGEDILFDSINERVIFIESGESDFTGLHDPDHLKQDNLPNLKVEKRANGDEIVVWESKDDSNMRIDFVKNLAPDTTVIWGFTDGDRFDLKNYKGDSAWNVKFRKDLTPDTTVGWGVSENNELRGNVRNSNFPIPALFNKIDAIFSRRLAQNNLLLKYNRVKQLDSLNNFSGLISIPYDYDVFGYSQSPLAIFSNYNGYVFGKIWPNILISLLLFGIVWLSFFFISKTWKEQLRLTKLKNEFISNMTHELNTPIATIGVALEALENYGAINDPVRRKEYFDISKQEVDRLKYLVDKVLNLSTLDQGYNDLNTEKEDLKNLIEFSIQKMRLHLDKNKANVSFNVQGDDFMASIDREHFSNVIHNLMDNAIKYSDDNPKIEISLESKEAVIEFCFSDNGIGIPDGFRGKIFDRFFRVPNEDRHNAKGHGLGLHYVKLIIEKHGGEIELLNASSGTSFLITIPKK